MRAMVLEAVEILIAFATILAAIRLFFLHAKGSWVRCRSFGVNDGEGTIGVIVESLIGVSML